MTDEKPTYAFCPECGFQDSIGEIGDCLSCGADCMGNAADDLGDFLNVFDFWVAGSDEEREKLYPFMIEKRKNLYQQLNRLVRRKYDENASN